MAYTYFHRMKQLVFFLSLILVLFSSCRDIKEPELRGIDNLKLGKLSLGKSIITLHVKYFNPNPFDATLKKAEGDAWMDSTYLGHFLVDTVVHVPAKQEFLVPVKLAVDMKYMLQHTLSSFTNEEVWIRITGKARAGRKGFYKNFPLKYEGKQNIAKLLGQ